MSIQQIQESKVLRTYGSKLGREGIYKRVLELSKEALNEELCPQDVMKIAGKIRALCIGCKCDSYWDEKQHFGYTDMYYEAKKATFKEN